MPRSLKMLTFLVLLATPGCFLFVSRSSPTVTGIDVRVSPGFNVGDGDVTVHPTVAYSRSLFGGVDDETDDILYLGGQVRSAPLTDSGIWVGGEAAYARRWTSFDLGAVPTETTNGWTLTALGGLPLLEGGFGTVQGFVAAGLNKYGGYGPYARIGVDFQPAFLTR